MDSTTLESLKYPIGKYNWDQEITDEVLNGWISTIEQFPARVEALVSGFNETQLDTPYRPDGWTVRQVLHHVSDSHLNSYIRYKWALTEEKPLIKIYYEDRWAKGAEYEGPVEIPMQMLKSLHVKWTHLLRSLTDSDFQRSFIHPESTKEISLYRLTGMYAWHCNHHYAHVANLAKREGWVS